MLKNTPMGSLVLLVTFALRAGAKDKAGAASPKDENFSGFGTTTTVQQHGAVARFVETNCTAEHMTPFFKEVAPCFGLYHSGVSPKWKRFSLSRLFRLP